MLKKIFINNYQNVNDNKVRSEYGKVAGIFGIVTNVILGIVKLIVGLISKSVSIMADSFNNLSDSASSLLTMLGFKLASKKPDNKHPYGYERYEYISSFVIALMMLIMGILFAKESIVKIFNKQDLNINIITFVVLFISIIIKIVQMYVYLDFSKAINSKTLKTTAIDTRNDIIATTSILISMIIMKIFNVNIDGYLGLIVSLFVIYSSVNMMNEVIEPIIGIVPTKELIDEIKQKLLSYEYVLGIHDLVIHNYGVHNNFVTVHIEIDSKMDMIYAHDLMDNIENDFKEDLNMLLTIHMDPVIVGDNNVDKIKKQIINNIKKIDKDLQIHDFRIVKGNTHTNILFDCVIPYDKEYSKEYIINYLKKNIQDNKHKYYYIIEIDRPYC